MAHSLNLCCRCSIFLLESDGPILIFCWNLIHLTLYHVSTCCYFTMLNLGHFGLCEVMTAVDLDASTVCGESEDHGAQS